MAYPIRTPRVNNNDDFVRLSAILASPGSLVRQGDPVCEVETDKATFGVEAERDGYFLKCSFAVGDTVEIGSVLVWMSDTAADAVPAETQVTASAGSKSASEPTLKAALLLAEYGLKPDQVPASSERLRIEDVEAYIRGNQLKPQLKPKSAKQTQSVKPAVPPPDVAADVESLDALERGMLRTVSWHRDEAVAGYVEIAYEPKAWEDYATEFQKEQRLLLSPLLGLMAYRLVALSRENPKLNATLHEDRKFLYKPVNIGFTIQSGKTLYLAVISSADQMTEREFVVKLTELQKQAMKGRLEPSQTRGATIAFTSMARWNVARHQPILPPYTSFMVAHAATVNGYAALGASYDHRLLTGADAVLALNRLARPVE